MSLGLNFASNSVGPSVAHQSLGADVKARMTQKLDASHRARPPEVAQRRTRGANLTKTLG